MKRKNRQRFFQHHLLEYDKTMGNEIPPPDAKFLSSQEQVDKELNNLFTSYDVCKRMLFDNYPSFWQQLLKFFSEDQSNVYYFNTYSTKMENDPTQQQVRITVKVKDGENFLTGDIILRPITIEFSYAELLRMPK